MKKLYENIPVKVSSVDSNSLWATFSTDDKDRHGDRVAQNWNLQNFMNNPVVLNSHSYQDSTETIGRVEALVQKDHSLEGKIRFAIDENPKAKVIFDLYKGGFLNAFSVGFMPGEEENELLELSAVSVPANAMALAKQKGIDVSMLDDEDIEEEEEEEDIADLMEDEQEELKIMFKEGRVLSASNRKKIQSAIDALQALLSTDKGYDGEDEEEPSEEENERQEDTDYVEETTEETTENKIEKALRVLQKEVETRSQEENDRAELKRKLNKSIRSLINTKNKV
jgi:hypothetical protein